MMISILQFRDQLAAYGLPLRDEPSDDHDPIPDGQYPTLALEVPADQANALLEADGFDPSEGAPAPGAELRRLLQVLQQQRAIVAWHAFHYDGAVYLHVQLTRDQATLWYSVIDWSHKAIESSQRLPVHSFA